jgi:DNA-binding response OmpR family regulator
MPLAPAKFIAEETPNSENSVAYVLDDDSEICALISRMLQAEGFVAVPFTSPDICLRQLKISDDYSVPKIIVLDLALGKTDAIEVLNQLNILKYKGRVLLVSGKDETALLEIERMGSSRGLMMLPSLKTTR